MNYKGKHIAKKANTNNLSRKHRKRGRGGDKRLSREEQRRRDFQRRIGGGLLFCAVLAACVPVGLQLAKPEQEPISAPMSVVSESAQGPIASVQETDLASVFVVEEPATPITPTLVRELCWSGELLTPQMLPEDLQQTAASLCSAAVDGYVLSDVIAQIVANEIGGLTEEDAWTTVELERAAVVWTIVNRCDLAAGASAEALFGAATAENQFAWFGEIGEIFPGCSEIAVDVLCRVVLLEHLVSSGHDSQAAAEMVGKLHDCRWFGGDGEHNYFRETYEITGNRWRPTAEDDPYIN
jgi:hypothetical protein